MKLIIYTDGSCYPNPGPGGGWGAVITTPDHAILACGRTASGFGSVMMPMKDDPTPRMLTTNNRQELMGILMALRLLEAEGHHIWVWSDSEWAVNSISGKYRSNKNKDLLDQIRMEIKRLGTAHCKFRHIKGHAGHPLNELADRLAGKGLQAVDSLKIEDGRWLDDEHQRLIEVVGFLPQDISDGGGSSRASSTLVTYHHTLRISFR